MRKEKSYPGMGQRINEKLEKMGKSQTWLAGKIGTNQSAVSQIISREATKHFIEISQALEVTVEWLKNGKDHMYNKSEKSDIDHTTKSRNNVFPLNSNDLIPMYGAVSASSPEIIHFTEDYMIEEVSRHPSVYRVKGAFAMQVAGNSMAPRHRHGEKVYIHPHQVPSIGQDCVIVQEPDGNAILKQFRGETSTEWKFSQLHPEKEFSINKADVRKIFAVVR